MSFPPLAAGTIRASTYRVVEVEGDEQRLVLLDQLQAVFLPRERLLVAALHSPNLALLPPFHEFVLIVCSYSVAGKFQERIRVSASNLKARAKISLGGNCGVISRREGQLDAANLWSCCTVLGYWWC